MGLRRVGLHADQLSKLGDGALQITFGSSELLSPKGETEVVEYVGIIRGQADCLLILGDGCLGVTLPRHGQTEVVVSFGVAGAQTGRPTEGLRGLMQMLLLSPEKAESVMRLRVAGLEFQGPSYMLDGCFRLPPAPLQSSQSVVRRRVVRTQQQRLLEGPDGVVGFAKVPQQ